MASSTDGAEIPEETLCAWRRHAGFKEAWAFTQCMPVTLGPWIGSTSIRTHGVSGFCNVWRSGSSELLFPAPVRVHFCRRNPCGYRYDNRVVPFLVHGRVLALTDEATNCAPSLAAEPAAGSSEGGSGGGGETRSSIARMKSTASDDSSLSPGSASGAAVGSGAAEAPAAEAAAADAPGAEALPTEAAAKPPSAPTAAAATGGVEKPRGHALRHERAPPHCFASGAGGPSDLARPSLDSAGLAALAVAAAAASPPAASAPAAGAAATAPSARAAAAATVGEETHWRQALAHECAPLHCFASEASAPSALARPSLEPRALAVPEAEAAAPEAPAAEPAAAEAQAGAAPAERKRHKTLDAMLEGLGSDADGGSLVPATALAEPKVLALAEQEETVDVVGTADNPAKLKALELCLQDDICQWATPQTHLPHLIFLVWAFENRRKVFMHSGGESLELLETFCPWAMSSIVSSEADGCHHDLHVLATRVEATPGSEGRHLRWPRHPLDVNHWHLGVKIPLATDMPSGQGHAPCSGAICGGDGEAAAICAGMLLDDLAFIGVLPLPTVADGDCGADVIAYWSGRHRTRTSWTEVRRWFCDSMWERRWDPAWLVLYDTFAHPPWQEKVEEMAAGMYLPLEVNAHRACDGDEGRGDVPKGLAWALRDMKGVSPGDLAAIATALPADALEYWEGQMNADRTCGGSGGGGGEEPKEEARSRPPRRKNRSYNAAVLHRLAKLYDAALKQANVRKAPRGFMIKFLEKHGQCSNKAFRAALQRAVRALATRRPREVAPGRRRVRGCQGHHLVKGGPLRADLFEWFCQVRSRVKGRMPLKVLECRARQLRDHYLKTALAARQTIRLPAITSQWLWRFRREHRISLRQPNRRWKVPRKILLHRLRVMWSNTIRLRAMALVLLGHDLEADGFDQKPFHLDEAGSKRAQTLALRGAPEIAIKELAGATRARWTANTWVTSRRALVEQGPPLEVLVKGGDGVLKSVEKALVDFGLHGVTAQVSNSGSYRREHVITFLERWLPRTVDRACGDGWRIVYCDAFEAHKGEAIQQLAWQHRAVVLLHGGGTTGVAQVNDTHLHGPLSRMYQELEMQAGFLDLLLDPSGCPSRDRATCVRDLALVWGRKELHLTALAGWKQNLILNALDGSEDHLASSEITAFWQELNMDQVRQDIIREVASECVAGRLEWSYEVVYAQLEEFGRSGCLDTYLEGQEDEGDPDDRVGEETAWCDDDPSPRGSEEDLPRAETPPAPLPPLSDAQRIEADAHASRLRALDEAQAIAPSDARLEKAFRDVRATMRKEACGRQQGDAAVAQAVRASSNLQRAAAEQLHEELKRRRLERVAENKAREEAMRRIEERSAALRREEIALATAGRRAEEAALSAARLKAIAGAAHGYSSIELGQGLLAGGGERFRQARRDLVRQVRDLGTELPFDAAASWDQWVRRWDAQGVLQHGRAWGSVVRQDMTDVVNHIAGGDAEAFSRWHRYWTRRWGLDLHDIRVPSAASCM